VRAHLSVFMLFVKSSLYKLLGIAALMGLGEFLLFFLCLSREDIDFSAWGLEGYLDKSGVFIVFAAAFLLLSFFLFRMGAGYGSRPRYTLSRLSLSERRIFFLQALANSLLYTLFLLLQLFIAYGLCLLYLKRASAYTSPQTLFLAFYRNDFLHALLPLEDVGGHIRNVFMLLGLGLCAAAFPYKQQRGSFGYEGLLLAILCAFLFPLETGDMNNPAWLILLAIILSYNSLRFVFRREENKNDPS